MKKKNVKQIDEFSYYMFTPDFFHIYDYTTEIKGREEPVHRYTATHILHQLFYLLMGGYSIFYMEKCGVVVSYVMYTKCRWFVFDSGNRNDYYVMFYYTYPEYRGNGYASVMMHMLFDLLQDKNDFYERIAVANTASINAAKKIGFTEDGFVTRSRLIHKIVRTQKHTDSRLFRFDRSNKRNNKCASYT